MKSGRQKLNIILLFSSFCLVNAFLHWNLWGFRRPEIRWMEIVAYLKKIYIILLGSGLYFDTHMKAWECALHWPWSWEGPEKRMWGWERQLRYSMWLLNLVFQVLTVVPTETSLWCCVKTAVHHRTSSSPGGSMCRPAVSQGAVLRLCMPTYWPKYHEALAELAWVRKECTELDYGLCSSVASLIFWWLLWMSTDFINSAGNVPQWKMAVHMNIWNKNGHLCYAVLMSGILDAVSWNLLLVHLRVNKIWQNAVLISGAGTRGIQTVVISLLVHRPLHRHKGILSLFAVNDTHQTVIVHMVSDYFKHQFWRDWNYPKEYKGESTSRCPRSYHHLSWCQPSCSRLLQRSQQCWRWAKAEQIVFCSELS